MPIVIVNSALSDDDDLADGRTERTAGGLGRGRGGGKGTAASKTKQQQKAGGRSGSKGGKHASPRGASSTTTTAATGSGTQPKRGFLARLQGRGDAEGHKDRGKQRFMALAAAATAKEREAEGPKVMCRTSGGVSFSSPRKPPPRALMPELLEPRVEGTTSPPPLLARGVEGAVSAQRKKLRSRVKEKKQALLQPYEPLGNMDTVLRLRLVRVYKDTGTSKAGGGRFPSPPGGERMRRKVIGGKAYRRALRKRAPGPRRPTVVTSGGRRTVIGSMRPERRRGAADEGMEESSDSSSSDGLEGDDSDSDSDEDHDGDNTDGSQMSDNREARRRRRRKKQRGGAEHRDAVLTKAEANAALHTARGFRRVSGANARATHVATSSQSTPGMDVLRLWIRKAERRLLDIRAGGTLHSHTAVPVGEEAVEWALTTATSSVPLHELEQSVLRIPARILEMAGDKPDTNKAQGGASKRSPSAAVALRRRESTKPSSAPSNASPSKGGDQLTQTSKQQDAANNNNNNTAALQLLRRLEELEQQLVKEHAIADAARRRKTFITQRRRARRRRRRRQQRRLTEQKERLRRPSQPPQSSGVRARVRTKPEVPETTDSPDTNDEDGGADAASGQGNIEEGSGSGEHASIGTDSASGTDDEHDGGSGSDDEDESDTDDGTDYDDDDVEGSDGTWEEDSAEDSDETNSGSNSDDGTGVYGNPAMGREAAAAALVKRMLQPTRPSGPRPSAPGSKPVSVGGRRVATASTQASTTNQATNNRGSTSMSGTVAVKRRHPLVPPLDLFPDGDRSAVRTDKKAATSEEVMAAVTENAHRMRAKAYDTASSTAAVTDRLADTWHECLTTRTDQSHLLRAQLTARDLLWARLVKLKSAGITFQAGANENTTKTSTKSPRLMKLSEPRDIVVPRPPKSPLVIAQPRRTSRVLETHKHYGAITRRNAAIALMERRKSLAAGSSQGAATMSRGVGMGGKGQSRAEAASDNEWMVAVDKAPVADALKSGPESDVGDRQMQGLTQRSQMSMPSQSKHGPSVGLNLLAHLRHADREAKAALEYEQIAAIASYSPWFVTLCQKLAAFRTKSRKPLHPVVVRLLTTTRVLLAQGIKLTQDMLSTMMERLVAPEDHANSVVFKVIRVLRESCGWTPQIFAKWLQDRNINKPPQLIVQLQEKPRRQRHRHSLFKAVKAVRSMRFSSLNALNEVAAQADAAPVQGTNELSAYAAVAAAAVAVSGAGNTDEDNDSVTESDSEEGSTLTFSIYDKAGAGSAISVSFDNEF